MWAGQNPLALNRISTLSHSEKMAEEEEKESCYKLNIGQDYQEIVSSRHDTNSQQLWLPTQRLHKIHLVKKKKSQHEWGKGSQAKGQLAVEGCYKKETWFTSKTGSFLDFSWSSGWQH